MAKGKLNKNVSEINKYCKQIENQTNQLLTEIKAFEAVIDDA